MAFSKQKPLVLSVTNSKGGVGKTTTSANLCGALTALGLQVLAISADPQKAGIDDHLHDEDLPEPSGGYRVLRYGEPIMDHIIRSSSGIDLLPGGDDLNDAEEHLSRRGQHLALKNRIAELPRIYDAIVIDCGPNLNLLTVNALHASNRVLVPLQYARGPICGYEQIRARIAEVQQSNPALRYAGVVGCNFDPKTKIARALVDDVAALAGPNLIPLHIRRDILAQEAWTNHVTVDQYAPSAKVTEDYRALAHHVLKRAKAAA